jgi:hypothetical protein
MPMPMPDPWPRFWKRLEWRLQRVIPADAKNTGIAPELRGKVPGFLEGGRWVPTVGPMAERRMTQAEARQGHRTGAGIGVLGAWCPGFDIDVKEPALAAKIVAFTRLYLGDAPCRGRSNSAHCLLMYETAVDGEGSPQVIRKRRIEFDGGAVEWLGSGQYWNLHGLHASGVPYEWSDPHPCDISLTVVTDAVIDAHCADLVVFLEGLGRHVKRHLHSGAAGNRLRIGEPILSAKEPKAVLQALAAYPCSIEHFGHRDDVVPFLCAVKAALGTAHGAHREAVLEWWRKSPLYVEDDYFDTIWDSIHDSALGWEWLDRRTGAGIEAQADYTEVPTALASRDPRAAAVESMLVRFRYARKQSLFVNIETGETLTQSSFCTQNTGVAPCGISGKKAAHNVFFNHPRAGNHSGVTYRPGQELIVDDEINLWRPSGLAPIEGDASPWLSHVAELIPDEAERDHFLDWLAFVLQRPGSKINHAIVLHTQQHGTGKDTVLEPLWAGVGAGNYRIVIPEELIGIHTSYFASQVLYVPEMKNFSKGEVYIHLKRNIANPPPSVRLRLMFKDTIEIPNFQCWIFTTNSGDAIAIEQGDRRLWMPTCVGHPKEDTAYYKRLWHWLEHENGSAIAVGWLMKQDISAFNVHDAPMTQAKQRMIDLTTAPGILFLESQFEPEGKFFEREYMTAHEMRQLLADNFGMFGGDGVVREVHLTEILHRRGFKAIAGRHWVDGNMKTVWTKLDAEIVAAGDISVAARLKADQKRGPSR